MYASLLVPKLRSIIAPERFLPWADPASGQTQDEG